MQITWEKEKFCRLILKIKIILFVQILFFCTFFVDISYANIKQKLINKLTETKTLSFNFIQKIDNKEEVGRCSIKYPLLMKCNYNNLKQKIIISNGKTGAVIKKKYKKIYYYPLKSTPLFIILQKEKILEIIKNNQPTKIGLNIIEFEFIDKKSNKLKIFFDTNSLELKGWKTKDSYSNNVSFMIFNVQTNEIIEDNFFKIPKEEDL